MVNLKVTVLHNKMWIICDTEEPRGTMQCSCNKAWLGYTVFCACLEALLVRMNRPGINLQMSISAKVDDIMIKIADYTVKWSMFAAFFSFFKFYHK